MPVVTLRAGYANLSGGKGPYADTSKQNKAVRQAANTSSVLKNKKAKTKNKGSAGVAYASTPQGPKGRGAYAHQGPKG